MSVYIPGMVMPTSCEDCPMAFAVNFGILCTPTKRIVGDGEISKKQGFCPLVPVPEHGDLIERDKLRSTMYHEAFETDTTMQRWDSGCWMRYKLFENNLEAAPTVIPADKETEK